MTRGRMPVSRSMAAQERAAVLGFARGAGRRRENLVDLCDCGEPVELRQRLQRRVHGGLGQAPAVEAAGAEPDHFLFAVDDLERQVRADPDDDHVDRVGADVDCGESHVAEVAERCASIGILPRHFHGPVHASPRRHVCGSLAHALATRDATAIRRRCTRSASLRRRLREALRLIGHRAGESRKLASRAQTPHAPSARSASSTSAARWWQLDRDRAAGSVRRMRSAWTSAFSSCAVARRRRLAKQMVDIDDPRRCSSASAFCAARTGGLPRRRIAGTSRLGSPTRRDDVAEAADSAGRALCAGSAARRPHPHKKLRYALEVGRVARLPGAASAATRLRRYQDLPRRSARSPDALVARRPAAEPAALEDAESARCRTCWPTSRTRCRELHADVRLASRSPRERLRRSARRVVQRAEPVADRHDGRPRSRGLPGSPRARGGARTRLAGRHDAPADPRRRKSFRKVVDGTRRRGRRGRRDRHEPARALSPDRRDSVVSGLPGTSARAGDRCAGARGGRGRGDGRDRRAREAAAHRARRSRA